MALGLTLYWKRDRTHIIKCSKPDPVVSRAHPARLGLGRDWTGAGPGWAGGPNKSMRKPRKQRAPISAPGEADLDDAARSLFQAAVDEVTPLSHDLTEPYRPRPRARARFREYDERQVLQDTLSNQYDPGDYETGEELWYARPGLQRRLLKRLRRGHFTLEAECDLHGLTVLQARQVLVEFLHHCRTKRLGCVRIIHGKGHGSHQRLPVLKTKMSGWLRQRDEVLAFCSARPFDGGTGALYVLLKKA